MKIKISIIIIFLVSSPLMAQTGWVEGPAPNYEFKGVFADSLDGMPLVSGGHGIIVN